MCTLALVRLHSTDYPLIVAANRDENLARPSTPPRLWEDPVPFVGGRDEVAGGTWLGVNARGLVVGLTNHWTGAAPDPDRASRGGVVRELLQAPDLGALRAALAARDPDATNPFLLVAADRSGEALWSSSAEGLVVHAVREPVFALGNQTPGTDPGSRVLRLGDGLEALVEAAHSDPQRLLGALAPRLGEHRGDRGPLESVCVHTDRGYGTVSSSLLLLGRDPAADRLFHAAGPPCTTAFEDHSGLLGRMNARG